MRTPVLICTLILLAGTVHAEPADLSTVPLEEVEITLERTACFGICPVYSVTLCGDGTVRYVGERFVRVEGEVEDDVPVASVVRLVNRFLAAHFFDAAPSYRRELEVVEGPDGTLEWRAMEITDMPTTILSLRIGANAHRVSLYFGYPQALMDLADAVDEAAGTARWVEKER